MEMGTTDVLYPLDELSVSFTNANGTLATGTNFSTKNFSYNVASLYNGHPCINVSRLLDGNNGYEFSLPLFSGRMYCSDYVDGKMCGSFGFLKKIRPAKPRCLLADVIPSNGWHILKDSPIRYGGILVGIKIPRA